MDCYREAELELTRRKTKAHAVMAENIRSLRDQNPAYTRVEQEIKSTGLELVKCGFTGRKDENGADIKNKLKNRLEALSKEKQKILIAEGLPEDFGEKVYYCPICRDEGYVINQGYKDRCSCFLNIYTDMLTSKQADLDTSCRFWDFKWDYYPENPNQERYGISGSPKEYMKRILEMCIDFTKHIPSRQQKNLIFTGKTGIGKTFMCSCIANELLSRGISVLYIKASEMFNQITFNHNEELKRQLYQVQTLIIDDLGIEKQTDMRYSDFLELLDKRNMSQNKSGYATIISTNLNPNGLLSYYDERICSRLFGNFDLIRFIGEDIRLINREV